MAGGMGFRVWPGLGLPSGLSTPCRVCHTHPDAWFAERTQPQWATYTKGCSLVRVDHLTGPAHSSARNPVDLSAGDIASSPDRGEGRQTASPAKLSAPGESGLAGVQNAELCCGSMEIGPCSSRTVCWSIHTRNAANGAIQLDGIFSIGSHPALRSRLGCPICRPDHRCCTSKPPRTNSSA
jgi:hypothetical protein